MFLWKILVPLALAGISLYTLIGLISALFKRSKNAFQEAVIKFCLLLCMGCCLSVGIGFNSARAAPIEHLASNLRTGNTDLSYQFFSPELQIEFKKLEGLNAWAKEVHPESWLLSGNCGSGNQGIISGYNWTDQGELRHIAFDLQKDKNEWIIVGVTWEEADQTFHAAGQTDYECPD